MSGTIPKDLRKYVKALERAGGRVVVLKNGHLRFIGPDGRIIGHESATPGRPSRSKHRVKVLLRRAGVTTE